MNNARARIDVVLPLGHASDWGDNNELRFCLRALDRHFLDLGCVWIIGVRPAWLSDAAVHLPLEDPYQHNKDGNIIHKLAHACRDPRLSDAFLRCSDDELFLQDTTFTEMSGHFEINLRRVRYAYQKPWRLRLRRTSSYLESQHKRSLMFDCHLPVPMHKQRFLDVTRDAPYATGNGLCVDSLYFNMADEAPRKPLQGELSRIRDPAASVDAIATATKDSRFLNFNDHGLNDALKAFLQRRFPQPSRFEIA